MSYLNSFTTSVIAALDANTNNLVGLNSQNNMWTEATQNLGNQYLYNSNTAAGNPSPAAGSVDADVAAMKGQTGSTLTNSLTNLFNNWGNHDISEFDMTNISELQGLVAQSSASSEQISSWDATLSQESQLVQAESTRATSTGNAAAQATAGAAQNATTGGQTDGSAGSSVSGLLSSGAGVQQSIAA